MFDPEGQPTFKPQKAPICPGIGVGLGVEGQAYIGPIVSIGFSHYGYLRYCIKECIDAGYSNTVNSNCTFLVYSLLYMNLFIKEIVMISQGWR